MKDKHHKKEHDLKDTDEKQLGKQEKKEAKKAKKNAKKEKKHEAK